MYKIEEIRRDMIIALKEYDKKTKETLSYLLGLLKNEEIDKQRKLTEEDINRVILRLLSQLEETLKSAPIGRTDIVEETKNSIEIVKKYAPEMMDEETIKSHIVATIEELEIKNPMINDKGKIMKSLMPKIKNKAEGKLVNKIIDDYLK